MCLSLGLPFVHHSSLSPAHSPPAVPPYVMDFNVGINVRLCQHAVGGRVFSLFLHSPLSTPSSPLMCFQAFFHCAIALLPFASMHPLSHERPSPNKSPLDVTWVHW